jgi:hypothetical protein
MPDTAPSGTTRYLCPVRCGWWHDVPPPSAADTAGITVPPDVTDLGGAISHLAAGAALQRAANTEAALVAHLGTHTMLEFVTELERLHAEIRRLAPAPSDPGGGGRP